jgi:hypothetical protein
MSISKYTALRKEIGLCLHSKHIPDKDIFAFLSLGVVSTKIEKLIFNPKTKHIDIELRKGLRNFIDKWMIWEPRFKKSRQAEHVNILKCGED